MLKEDYKQYYIPGSDHYLIPKDVFIELFNEMNNWKEQAKEKKEYVFIGNAQNKTRDFINDITKENTELKNKQKEFIVFLERNWETTQDIWYIKILNKYLEIIGVENESTRI